MALELVPISRRMLGSDIPRGNTELLITNNSLICYFFVTEMLMGFCE